MTKTEIEKFCAKRVREIITELNNLVNGKLPPPTGPVLSPLGTRFQTKIAERKKKRYPKK